MIVNKLMGGVAAGALLLPCALMVTQGAFAAADAVTGMVENVETVVVTGQSITFANTQVTKPMMDRQAALTSVNDVLNEMPGVLVSEGDSFGSSDWATSITIRGFSSSGSTQQIGTTIDGIPNGGSSYGGGSKANRYVDVLNLKTVQVSQGTSDIASRSNEALGGTLNYVISDPENTERLRMTVAGGDYSARKVYVRYDTGEVLPGTYVWINGSSQKVHDWIDGTGHTSRSQLAGKIISTISNLSLTGYLSYDDADEAEYGSVSAKTFAADPEHDSYTGTWTGIPYLDQSYRSGSRALRKNVFGYTKGKIDLGTVNVTVTAYGHHMKGRGDWLPPYLVDVTSDGSGTANSEYTGGSTVYGGSALGKIYFVTPTGASANMASGCEGSTLVPSTYNPNCYDADAAPVMSYRHTHYLNRRIGLMADADWTETFGDFSNVMRAGLWLEDGRAKQTRDWHRVINALEGMAYNHTPYWVQFSTRYGVNEFMYYAEDALTYGPVTARLGVKQFYLQQTRLGLLVGDTSYTKLVYNSKPLISAGLTYTTPVDGLEMFAGYSQNFASIQKGLLDDGADALKAIKPEQANNVEIGARYTTGKIQASLTLFDISFDNRIADISSNLISGIDYLSETDSAYINVGGIHSYGVEAALAWRISPELTLSGTYSYNRAKYRGTGDTAKDADIGITPGAQVYNAPKNMGVLSADWHGSMLKAGLSAKYVDDRFIDTEATEIAPQYTLFNAYVGVDLGKISTVLQHTDFTVTINNLTNKRYLAGADGGTAFLGAARTITAALTADF